MADTTEPSASTASSQDPAQGTRGHRPIDIRIGHEELVIRGLYETISIVNDVLIGVVFLIGSFLFFSTSTVFQGTVLFVIGSVLMLIRPTIRLTRRLHLQRLHSGLPAESARDF